jgi:hypothetical protein
MSENEDGRFFVIISLQRSVSKNLFRTFMVLYFSHSFHLATHSISLAMGRCSLAVALGTNKIKNVYIGDGRFEDLVFLGSEFQDRTGRMIDRKSIPISETSGFPLTRLENHQVEPYYRIAINEKVHIRAESGRGGEPVSGKVIAILSDSYLLLEMSQEYQLLHSGKSRYVSIHAGYLWSEDRYLVHTSVGSRLPVIVPKRRFDFRSARMRQNRIKETVEEHESRWNYDGGQTKALNYPSFGTYDAVFFGALGNKSVGEFLSDRRDEYGFSTNVLDLFGSAVFLDDLQDIDTLTGARLESIRSHRLPPSYPNPKWDEVTGDFTLKSSWAKLRDNMSKRNISHFDLIIFRPVGGGHIFDDSVFDPNSRSISAAKLIRMLREAYSLLSSEDGTILVSLDEFSAGDPSDYLSELLYSYLTAHGAEVQVVGDSHKSKADGFGPVIKIIKRRTSASNLSRTR